LRVRLHFLFLSWPFLIVTFPHCWLAINYSPPSRWLSKVSNILPQSCIFLLNELQLSNSESPDLIIWTGYSSGKYKVAVANKKLLVSSCPAVPLDTRFLRLCKALALPKIQMCAWKILHHVLPTTRHQCGLSLS